MFIKDVAIEERAPFSATGLTVNYIVYDESRNTHASGATTEIGSTGVYYISFTPDIDGDWTLYMYCSTTGEKHTFHYPVRTPASTSTTHTITTANDKTETQVFEITKTTIYHLSIYTDLDVLESAAEGDTITFRLYNKVDGSNYSDQPLGESDYVVGSSDEYPNFELNMVEGNCKLTVQCSDDVTVSRNFTYRYITMDVRA